MLIDQASKEGRLPLLHVEAKGDLVAAQAQPLSVISAPKPDPQVQSPPTIAPIDNLDDEEFDVMLSYQWSSSQPKVLAVKKGLEGKGLKVWMDVEEMRGNINQRMAEAIDKSLVIVPFLNGDYQRSYNCSKELNYADLRKKKLVPCLNLGPNDKPIGWAFAITAQLLYGDVSKLSPDTPEFDAQVDILYHEISSNISDIQRASASISRPLTPTLDPLTAWLQPVDFASDLEQYSRSYIEGTRDWAIQQVRNWLEDANGDRVLWLNGGAGLGKSMIAYLVSQHLPPDYILASIFFCRHNDQQKSSVERLVATLLHSLSTKLPHFHRFLEQQMEADHNNVSQGKRSILTDPRQAFKTLLLNGLNSLPEPHPNLLFILDALDECGAQGDPQRNGLLELLKEDCKHLPSWVRIFTTARPERDVWETLQGIKSAVLKPSDDLNLKDIQVFLRHHLTLWSIGGIDSTGPGLEQCVVRLAQKSDGVFIYARMAVRELLERKHTKFKDWNSVLEAIEEYQGGLDDVYGRVLGAALDAAPDVVKNVLAAIICAKVPLTQEGLAVFLKVKESQVGVALMHIRSMLNIEHGLISVLHKSLKDYITSPQRCKNPRYFIDSSVPQQMFAIRCLELMNETLVAGLSKAPADISEEYTATSRGISLPLQYACQFWGQH
ncbi:UNVERIFIED_CONTAM: hypothetical protein HDU68_009716, partial [Siphonaria sp. JEL0065]